MHILTLTRDDAHVHFAADAGLLPVVKMQSRRVLAYELQLNLLTQTLLRRV